jgi:hypothetical protein
MQKLFAYVLAMGCVGTSAVFFQRDSVTTKIQSSETQLAADGAFRDGLYVGKLDRTAKKTMHPPVGRWSTEKDRASFVAGYRQGFNQQGTQE